uniref:Uncharacterized protein n=1 Tax=Arion vulgaris TaxID=1028688 RepID=A0A0B6ZFT7_9EUPU
MTMEGMVAGARGMERPRHRWQQDIKETFIITLEDVLETVFQAGYDESDVLQGTCYY